MSNFVVSARKYRPDRFGEVVGQNHVTKTLRNALIRDQLAHAILFCGPRGVGKTTCARILAKILNCSNPTETFDPCDECESCQAFNEQTSFNIIELDAASNNSVEHIRSLVEQVRFPPQRGDYKVFIIDEVHMLSTAAFNAFLKTLEEPPPYAIFILATTEKHKIIPTILSRCQIYDFKRIGLDDMVPHLDTICRKEGVKAEDEALNVIAQKADGALRDALSILDRMISTAGQQMTYEDVIQHLNVLDYDYYFRATEALTTEHLDDVFILFDEVIQNGFDGDLFMIGLAQHFRDLLLCKDESTVDLLEVGSALKKRYLSQAKKVPVSFLLSALEIANQCDIHYSRAKNKRLHVEMALSKMTYLTRIIDGENMFSPESEEDNSPRKEGKAKAVTTDQSESKKPSDSPPSGSSAEESNAREDKADDQPEGAIPSEKAGEDSSEQKEESSEKEKESGGREAAAAQEEEQSEEDDEANEETQTEDPSDDDEAESREEPPTDSSEEKSAAEPSSDEGENKEIRKTDKRSTPSLGDIGQLAEEVDTDDDREDDGQRELNLDNLTTWWNEQTNRQSLPTLQKEMQGAKLKVREGGDALCIEVGSRLGKGRLQQERDLIHRLRDEAGIPGLTILFEVNREEGENGSTKTKPLSFKEKYERMKEKNPLIEELRERFDLKIDRSG